MTKDEDHGLIVRFGAQGFKESPRPIFLVLFLVRVKSNHSRDAHGEEK